MPENYSAKENALKKLREESSNIYLGTRFILFLNIAYAILIILLLLISLLYSRTLLSMRSESVQKGIPLFISIFAGVITSGREFTTSGEFNYSYYIISLAGQLLPSLISACIFYTVSRMFNSIITGNTPFTDICIFGWKRCYRIFAVITVIYFLLSFIIRPFILAMISPLLGACFFYSLSLIFEYGALLQQESDETL